MSKIRGSGLLNFVRALWSEWFTAMSGAISVPAALAALWLDNPTLRILAAITAVACFWAAAFRLWQRERIRAETAEEKSETLTLQLDQRSPKLMGTLEQITFLTATPQNGPSVEAILVNLTVRNTGTPTIADRFEMSVGAKSGVTYPCQIEMFPDELTIPFTDGPTFVFKRHDAIYDKTTVPIPTGGQARGWMFATVAGTTEPELNQEGTTVTVIFEDITGAHVTASDTVRGSPQNTLSYRPDGTGGPRVAYRGKENG